MVCISFNLIKFHREEIFVDYGFTDSHEFTLELRIIVIYLTNILVHLIQLNVHIFCIKIRILINQSSVYNVIIQLKRFWNIFGL